MMLAQKLAQRGGPAAGVACPAARLTLSHSRVLSSLLFSGSSCAASAAKPEVQRGGAARRQSGRSAAAAASTLAEPSTAPSPGLSYHGKNILQVLRERGLVQEVTSDEMEAAAAATSLSVYCGFDPTADSLHLGNLLGIIVLSWFQKCGHAPVALLGGATGRVGDPSGRSSERPILSDAEIERNVAGIGRVLSTILERNAAASSSGNGVATRPVKVVNNLEWFGGMGFLAFLRDIGKYARVSTMLAKDSVKSRMESESGISFTEFTYQLLQGYDFVHLCREHDVRVQVGGSDQWGNITAGTDLVRRLLGSNEGQEPPACYGLTFPLLVDSEGKKFGKSTGGAIWLAADKLSPYKFYQYLFSTTDADVVKFLKMLTFLPLAEIEALEAAMQQPGYAPNTAQRRLAEEVTRFVHGEEGLQQALRATEALKPGSATQLDAATLEDIAGDAPSATLASADVIGKPLADVVAAVKMLPSKSEVKRMVKGGGVYVNNQKIADPNAVVAEGDLIEGRLMLVAAGKKNKMLIRVTP